MGKHQGQNNAREWAQPKEIPPYLDQGTKVLRLIQLCPAPQPWHWPQGRALPFPPKFLLQSSHLQIQRAASPWPYRTPGWVLCCQLWVWRTLHWLYCPWATQERVLSFPAGQPGVSTAPGEQPGPWMVSQWGQRWPEAKVKVAVLGISRVPQSVAISRTVLPIQA